MAQQPNIGYFTDGDLPEDEILQSDSFSFLEDVDETADPSGIVVDLSASILNDCNSLHRSLLPPLSDFNVADKEPEDEFKPHEASSTPCQCLYRVVMVMDKLAVQDDGAVENWPNGVLTLIKEGLGNCTNMIGCATCTGRVENILALAILMDKLARLCHHIVQVTGDSTQPTPAMRLGDYKVDSAEEYGALIGSLLGVQLRRFQKLGQRLQQVSVRFHSETLEHRITVCSGFITESLDAVRNFGR